MPGKPTNGSGGPEDEGPVTPEEDLEDDLDDLFEDDWADDDPDEDPDDLGDPQETDEWAVLRSDATRPATLAQPETTLPWLTRAEIPALQMTLPAVLDPTRPDSEWRVPQPPSEHEVDVLLRLGPIEVRTTLKVLQGEPHGLRLGRDVLGGRVLVQS